MVSSMTVPVPCDSFYEPPEQSDPPADMTCELCDQCMITPDQASKYGWCIDAGEWTLLDENVMALGCDNWEL